MDINNQNQYLNSPTVPSTSTVTKKTEFPKIVGLVFLVITVAGIGYFFGAQRSNTTIQTQQPTVLPTHSIVPSVAPSSVTWKTQTIESKRIAAGSDIPTILYVDFQIPPNWTMMSVKKDENCTDYIITSEDQSTTMTVQTMCGGLVPTYSPWPEDGVIVKEQSNAADDNSTSYRVRYYDTQKRQYNYQDALARPPLNTSTTQLMDSITITHNPFVAHTYVTAFVKVNLSGTESEKEQRLKITDQIAASMKLR